MKTAANPYLRSKLSNTSFHVVNYFINFLIAVICFYPFLYLFLVSISDPHAVARGEVILFPVNTTLLYYKQVFELDGLFHAVFISAVRTLLGTVITLFFTTMIAYVLTKKQFKWRKVFYWMIIFTMYVSAGLIPYVLTMTALGLKNSFFLYILPGAVNAFGMVLIKTYIESIPQEVEESAIVDGAGYMKVLMRIVVPMSKPVIATVAVLTAVGQWNSFQDNFFLVQEKSLTTLQLMLWRFLNQAQSLAQQVQSSSRFSMSDLTPPNPFTLRCAISVVTMLPVMMVYPFLQRYFVKGIMLGAVKG